MTEDQCHPVEVDDETIRVHGAQPMSSEARDAFTAIVRAAKGRLERDNATTAVLAEVLAERRNQDAKWGQQNHPDRVQLPRNPYYDLERWRQRANAWKDENEVRARTGAIAWDGILLEEVYEALAEDDPARLRAELIEAIAVGVAWIEAIDRRAAAS